MQGIKASAPETPAFNTRTRDARKSSSRSAAGKSVVSLLLTFVAGVVDVVGYLAIYHIFTAHLSGRTVHLGRDLIARD
jgi:uncharacterized membrane protein YoaK (UPF0700 family)